jgi:putative membrane protein
MKRKIYRLALLAVLMAFILFTFTFAYAGDAKNASSKNETVYVVLDHYGKVLDQRVVNRIQAGGETGQVRDFGEYLSVKNITPGITHEAGNGEIRWDTGNTGETDISYEGVTDKQLPIDVEISYFLDGVRTEPENIAGKGGTVGIEISINNSTGSKIPVAYNSWEGNPVKIEETFYIPFLVQVSYEADLEIFSKVDAEDAIKVVTGDTMTLGFSAFPYPDAKVKFTMQGTNIELNPIMMTVIPYMPPMPSMVTAEDFEKLLEGIEQLTAGFEQFEGSGTDLVSGVSALADGAGKLQAGSKDLVGGYDGIRQGFATLKQACGEISAALNQVAPAMNEIKNSAGEVSASIGQMKEAADAIANAGNQLSGGFSELQALNSSLAEQAQALIQNYPAGSELHTLGMTILAQNEALNKLASSGTMLGTYAVNLGQGLGALQQGFDNEFVPGLGQLADSMTAVATGYSSIIDGLNEFETGQNAYRSALVEYFKGIETVSQGLQELDRNLGMLYDGLQEMNTAGISGIREGLIQAVEGMRFADAVEAKMEELVDGYRSFMDNENNRNSAVQFIMKTQGIKTPANDEPPADTGETQEKGFLQRLLDLFKNIF